eukprot:625699-Hanusia_phi.AAC.1
MAVRLRATRLSDGIVRYSLRLPGRLRPCVTDSEVHTSGSDRLTGKQLSRWRWPRAATAGPGH